MYQDRHFRHFVAALALRLQKYTSSRIATIALKELAVGLAVVLTIYIRDIDIERKGDRKTEIGRQNGNEA